MALYADIEIAGDKPNNESQCKYHRLFSVV